MSLSMPMTIYARKEKDGDDTYLLAWESPDDAVDDSGIVKVGVYKLQTVNRYQKITKIVKEG